MNEHKEKAVAHLLEHRQELVSVLERVDMALAALEAKKPASNRSSRATKACCTKKEVIAIFTGLLRDNEELSVSELEELAKDQIVNERQKSLSGFAMRMKEALADSLFTEYAPGKYRLARREDQSR